MSRNSLKNVAKLIDIANNEVSIEEQFVTDLKNSIEKYNNQPYKPSQTIKPSSFNCIRNAYYQLVGAEPEQSKATYNLAGICESGSNRHLNMQRNIIKMKDTLGIDIEYIDIEEFVKSRNLIDLEIREKQEIETKLYNRKYNMSFMTDGIIKYKSKYFIFEFKTETADKFYKRTGVDESHFNQAIAYSLNFGLDNVLFLYESRNDCSLKCYLFTVTQTMRDELIQKIELCNNCAKHNIIPPKPLDVSRKTCTYCQYKRTMSERMYNMKSKKRIVSQETKDKISKKNKGRVKDTFELQNLRRVCGRSVNQYDKDGNFIKTFECMIDGAREFNINKQSIYLCCRCRNKSAGGYIWEYADKEKNNAE